MLTEKVFISRIEVLHTGMVQICRVTQVIKNDEVIAETNYRYCLNPQSDLTDQPENVVAICKAAWTESVIKEFNDMIAKQPDVLQSSTGVM